MTVVFEEAEIRMLCRRASGFKVFETGTGGNASPPLRAPAARRPRRDGGSLGIANCTRGSGVPDLPAKPNGRPEDRGRSPPRGPAKVSEGKYRRRLD